MVLVSRHVATKPHTVSDSSMDLMSSPVQPDGSAALCILSFFMLVLTMSASMRSSQLWLSICQP